MNYLDFLREVHRLLEPPTYLEVGVRTGESLALSRARSIGIDPEFTIKAALDCHLTLFRTTSDAYFRGVDPLAPLGRQPIALSFIDGMHLFEFALRDFLNIERHSGPAGVIVLDDMLPRSVDEAARDRHTTAWTGDVYKLDAVLEQHRPDLIRVLVNTRPTGLLLVLGLDPANNQLANLHDALVQQWVRPDPQEIPEGVLDRRDAVDPRAVLDAPFWSFLRDAWRHPQPGAVNVSELRHLVEEGLGGRRPGRLQQAVRRLQHRS